MVRRIYFWRRVMHYLILGVIALIIVAVSVAAGYLWSPVVGTILFIVLVCIVMYLAYSGSDDDDPFPLDP